MKHLVLIFILFSNHVFSEEYYLHGSIKAITATTNGIMIQMDNGIPNICDGTPYNWLLIKQEYPALISMILTVLTTNKTKGTVYVSGRENGNGYCLVSQYDPVENQ